MLLDRGRCCPIAVLLALLAGCSVDQDAKTLIQPMHAAPPPRPAWVDFGGEHVIADGTTLSYWGIRHAASATAPDSSRGTALLLHGALTNKATFAALGRKVAAAGWDVILLDLPGHGGSSGQYITWGAKEKFQIRQFMHYALAADGLKLPNRIYVLGGSMGACIAVQYAAVEPRCRGVVAVAPPKSFRAVARLMFFLRDQKSLDERIARAGELARFNPDDASAVDAAAKLTCPLIVVHGKVDLVVPFSQGQEVFNAAKSPKKFVPLDLDGHVGAQYSHDDLLVELIGELDKLGK